MNSSECFAGLAGYRSVWYCDVSLFLRTTSLDWRHARLIGLIL